MAKVGIDQAVYAWFREIRDRQNELQRFKDYIHHSDEQIKNLYLEYMDSRWEAGKDKIKIVITRYDNLRNRMIDKLVEALDLCDIQSRRAAAYLTFLGDKGVITDCNDEIDHKSKFTVRPQSLFIKDAERLFNSRFFLQTPYVANVVDSDKSVTFGRTHVAVNDHYNYFKVNYGSGAHASFVDKHSIFAIPVRKLFEGEIETEELPDFIREVVESCPKPQMHAEKQFNPGRMKEVEPTSFMDYTAFVYDNCLYLNQVDKEEKTL